MKRSDADDKLRQGQTVKESIDRCIEIVRERQEEVRAAAMREEFNPSAILRELALAVTHLEDAQMRYARGRAIQLDRFAPADLDRGEEG